MWPFSGWGSSQEPSAAAAPPATPIADRPASSATEGDGEATQTGQRRPAPARLALRRSRSGEDPATERRAAVPKRRKSSSTQQLASVQPCFLTVLQQRSRRRTVPCVKIKIGSREIKCRGQSCGREDGHVCTVATSALDGGELTGNDRVRSDRPVAIDAPYARAVQRCWRPEWGSEMSEDELMKYGMCRHAENLIAKALVDAEHRKQPDAERPAAASGGEQLPTDALCFHPDCNVTRATLKKKGHTFAKGTEFKQIGGVWTCA